MPEGQVGLYNASCGSNDLSGWLEHLRVLMPPRGIAHVGAGAGAELAAYAQWTVPQLALIEADASLAKKLVEATRGREGWVVHPVMVSQVEGEQSFFVASNLRESGLLPAEALHSLWRNLRRTAERSMPAVTLDSLLATDEGAAGSDINWLVVDCLPAANVLAGGQELLKCCDVVVARVALGGGAQAQVPGTTLAETAELLAGHGFAQVAQDEERMPLLGRALFVRRLNAAQVSAQLSLLQEELRTERAACAAFQALHSAAQAEGKQAAAQVSSLQDEVTSERAQCAALQAAHHAALEGHQLAAAQSRSLREELASERAQHGALQAEHHAALESHRLAAAELLAQQSDALSAQQQDHQKQLEGLQGRLGDLSASHQQAVLAEAAALEQLAQVRVQMEGDGNLLRQELAELEAEVAPLREASVEHEQLIRELVDPLKAQLAAVEQAHAHQARQSAEQLENAAAINLRLASERDTLVAFKTEAISKLMRLQTQLDEVQEQKLNVEQQAGERSVSSVNLEKQIYALTERLRSQAEDLELAARAATAHQVQAELWLSEKLELESRLVQEVEKSSTLVSQMDAERQAWIAKSRDTADVNAAWQRKYEIEMVKVEAQIGLIRDVLLRPEAAAPGAT